MMKKRYRSCATVITTLMLLLSTGAAFARNMPKLVLNDHPVYTRWDAGEEAGTTGRGGSTADTMPGNTRIVSSGSVISTDAGGRSLHADLGAGDMEITASDKSEVLMLSPGDDIIVYGLKKAGSKDKNSQMIMADHVIKSSDPLTDDHYIYGGKSYKDSDSSAVTLANGRIRYNIPKRWVDTEVEKASYEKIFNSYINEDQAGKCYYINSLAGEREPEVFCVFYFNSNLFLEKDGNKGNKNGIEKAIIANICPDEKTKFIDPTTWKIIFPTATGVSSTGVHFDHYVAEYGNYRAEFAFAPMEGSTKGEYDGFCVAMHLYNDSSVNVDDILYVLDSLKVE